MATWKTRIRALPGATQILVTGPEGADLVKARHEVAAARARANTAKVLAEAPEVARMQELDVLVNLAGKNGTTGIGLVEIYNVH